MRYYYDTEFIEDGATHGLISIGIAADDGREYYAVAADAPWDRIRRHPWLMQNVVPQLPGPRPQTPIAVPQDEPERAKPGQEWFWDLDERDPCVKPRWVIRNEAGAFLTHSGAPELWARWGAHDHVVLMQLWGPMIAKPDALPWYTRDLQQEIDRLQEQGLELGIPGQGPGQHHALADAVHNRAVAHYLWRLTRERAL